MQIASTATVPVLTDPSVAIEGVVLGWHVLTSLLARPELALVLPALGGMFDLGSKGEDDDPVGDEASIEDDAGFAEDGDGDGMDEMDDWGDLDGGDDDWAEDAGGDQLGELEDKVNSLETEVSGLSSSMETVKEENRQLAETVDEADETIRKLLDVYEIVTRGINPFVDDAEAMGSADGSFGLFGDQASEEPIDPDIAEADAESFFDDDFDDFEEFDEEADGDGADTEAEDEPETGDDDEGGGASFDDLKAEYDADDGSWEDVVDEDEDDETADADDEADETEGEDEDDEPALDDEESAEELLADVDDDHEAEAWGDELGLDEEPAPEPEPDVIVDEGTPEPEPEPEPAAEPEPTFAPEPEPTPQANGNGNHPENGHADDGRPYLTRVPNGYAAEMVLLDWARYLVDEGDAAGAVDAFRHYERLGWISERVRRRLATLATELCDTPATAPVDLGPEHHQRSLEYVSRLAGRPVTGGLLRERGDGVTGGL